MPRYRKISINPYEDYHNMQSGGGSMVYFKGSPYQRGHGIGSFLGGLFRQALPLLKSGARTVGKELLQCGINVLDDLGSDNKTLKESVDQRTGDVVRNLKNKAKDEIVGILKGKGYKGKRRRKTSQSKSISRRRKTKKTKRQRKPRASLKGKGLGKSKLKITKVKRKIAKKRKIIRKRKTSNKRRNKYDIISTDIFS